MGGTWSVLDITFSVYCRGTHCEAEVRRFHPPPYYPAPPVVIGYLTGFHAMHVATVGPNIILLMTLMEHVFIYLF